LTQLSSLGFVVLYFSYAATVEAFKVVGIDASFEEDTSLANFEKKVQLWEALAPAERLKVSKKLVADNAAQVDHFVTSLCSGHESLS
jgi:hypothetical protein